MENDSLYGNEEEFEKSYTVTTHNKHIFVRPKKVYLLREKCLFGGKVLILGSGGFRILGIDYTE